MIKIKITSENLCDKKICRIKTTRPIPGRWNWPCIDKIDYYYFLPSIRSSLIIISVINFLSPLPSSYDLY